ncbi:uncharacterized protein LOC132920091 [Rhopalosiphum padi]|uniref:uncharacterized protein LOC132920091 n=1 Tax=Rhopalosiphum padi TaxID=40932 RepID=UPI00298E9F60|nr:uncharacterized protein LOC132920091 [Rhopalosiphum padi]
MKDCFFLIVCSVMSVVVLSTTTRFQTNAKEKLSIQNVSNNNVPNFHDFNWKLCKALHDVEKNNAVISSISVKLVLLMLYEGALGNTAKQIEDVVGIKGRKQSIRERYSQKLQSLQSHDKDDYELDIGTKLFMDSSVRPKNDFLEIISRWYNSSHEIVDFSKPVNAINSINQWVENLTHGRIQQLISETETKENTVLLLLNAIYFKGYWTIPFNKDLTRRGTFYLNSSTTVDVPLMTTYNYFKLSTIESLNARLISLPYQGNKFVMYIILPDNIDGLDNLINRINPSLLGDSIKNMKMFSTKVVLPKFNFEYTSILGPLLQELGITDMFGPNADLTNIGNDGQFGSLIVSNILQKSGLDVNEQGSTAHAATEAELDHRFGVTIEASFEVNRPFLFMIEDITMDTIIFVGQVMNPLSQGLSVVSIPIVNTPTQTPTPIKSVGDIELRMNLEQNVEFQRFSYFDRELFQELSSNQPDSNFVISPASIKSMLTLLSKGARGDTLNQLNNVLRLPTDKSTFNNILRINKLSMESSIIDLVVVNNIFVKNKNSISKNFKDTAEDLYSANITEINLYNIEASIQMINKQISDATHGLVNSIISKDDFDGNTELLLANVLYFKGDWFVEFNESSTKKECFYTNPNMCSEVNMMNLQDQIRYGHVSDINAQVVELLYKDTNFCMLVLLPDENTTFSQLLKDLQHNPFSKILNSLYQRNVNLYLPRFTINYSTKLSSALKKIGLSSMFNSNANLSSIFNPIKQVFVKDVTHKVTMEVNEKGSKASAVTVVSVIPLSNIPQSPPVSVIVNRPFIFYIFNRATKTILFSGQVHDVNSNIFT